MIGLKFQVLILYHYINQACKFKMFVTISLQNILIKKLSVDTGIKINKINIHKAM